MTNADWNTEEVIKTLIDQNWNFNLDKPYLRIKQGNTGGKGKGKRISTNEPTILLEEVDRDTSYSDVGQHTKDKEAIVRIEFEMSEDKVNEYWERTSYIFDTNNNRYDADPDLGGWVRLEYDDHEVPRSQFGKYNGHIDVSLITRAEPIKNPEA